MKITNAVHHQYIIINTLSFNAVEPRDYNIRPIGPVRQNERSDKGRRFVAEAV